MPFNKADILCMSTDTEEYLSVEEIAGRFGVSERTIDRVIEKYAKKLKKNQRREGRKKLYFWPDVLKCVKLHKGLAKEETPSVTIKKKHTKQRLAELEKENAQLREGLAVHQEPCLSPVGVPEPEDF